MFHIFSVKRVRFQIMKVRSLLLSTLRFAFLLSCGWLALVKLLLRLSHYYLLKNIWIYVFFINKLLWLRAFLCFGFTRFGAFSFFSLFGKMRLHMVLVHFFPIVLHLLLLLFLKLLLLEEVLKLLFLFFSEIFQTFNFFSFTFFILFNVLTSSYDLVSLILLFLSFLSIFYYHLITLDI